MDAPTCRLCGAAHWANAPHKFKSEAHSDAALTWKPDSGCKDCAAKDAEILKLRARVRFLESDGDDSVRLESPPADATHNITVVAAPNIQGPVAAKPNADDDRKAKVRAYQREYMARRRKAAA